MRRAQPVEQHGQLIEQRRADRADGERALLAGGGLLHRELQLLKLPHELLHGRQDGRPGRGELGAPARTLEQLDLQCVLEHLDLVRQRRLGHPQALGRAAEVALFGNSVKEPEVPDESEVDHGVLYPEPMVDTRDSEFTYISGRWKVAASQYGRMP